MTERQPPRLDIPRPRPDLPNMYQEDRRERTARPTEQPTRRQKAKGRRRAGSPLLSALFYVALTLVTVIAGATTFLFIAAPTDLIRDRLVAEVKARTGRDLTIAGQTSFTIFPALGISMSDIALSPPPGMAGGPTLTAGGLDVSVQAWPLLSSQIKIQRFVLRRPVLDLRVDNRGQKSWQFGELRGQNPAHRRIQLAQAAKTTGDGGGLPPELDEFIKGSTQPKRSDTATRPVSGGGSVTWGGVDSLALDDVRIEDGSLRYTDERTKEFEEITAISLRLGLKSLNAPLFISGKATVRGEPMSLDGRVTSPEQIASGTVAKVLLKAGSKIADANVDGGLKLSASGFDWDGDVVIDAPSLAGLVRFSGRTLADVPGAGRFKLASRIKATDTVAILTNARASLDGTEITGDLTTRLAGTRPTVIGDLQLSELNIDKLTALASAIANAPLAPRKGASRTFATPLAAPAKSITDLIEAAEPPPAAPPPATKVRGYTGRDGWSEQPIDLAALTVVDIELKLSLARLVHQQIKTGRTNGSVQLKAGQLRVSLDQMQLYDGIARGLLTLSGQGPDAVIGINLVADGVAAQALFKDAAGFDGISGKGRLNLAVTGRGASERAIVETSSGKADLTFTDGALNGYNFPQIIRGLGQGRFTGLDRTPAEKTDFSELAASFVITSGIARTQDLRMASPLLRVAGAGQVNLAARTLDLALKPKLVGTLAGQGGAALLQGVELPLKLTGPWDRPTVTPDVDLLKDPGKAAEAAKEIGRQLTGKSPDEIIRGLTGGSGEGGDKTRAKAKQILDQLLKR